jgi:hypothetical protein
MRLIAIGAAMAIAACGSGGDSSTAPPPLPTTPVGSYAISTVNGKGLPVAVASDTSGLYKLEITSGTMALTADGKYSVVTSSRQTIPGNVSLFVDSTGGTWVLSGANVLFTNSQDGTNDTAAWSNAGQLTFAEVNGTTITTFVYGLAK